MEVQAENYLNHTLLATKKDRVMISANFKNTQLGVVVLSAPSSE